MTCLSQCTKERATDELRFGCDGWNLIATLNSQLSTLNSFAWGLDLSGSFQGAGGIGGLLWVNNGSASTHFVSYDGNGNVTALVSAADGSESARYEYGPFGEVIRASGPAVGSMVSVNPFRFSTKYQDDETDLLYYGYRYYSASTGRWLSRDPMGEKGGLNYYAFGFNDSLNAIDYLGLLAPPPIRPPIAPPPVLACIVVFAGTYYVTSEIPEATGAHEALGDLIGELIAPPIVGGPNRTLPGSPFPAGTRDPLTLPQTNPGPCAKCGNGCKPCPSNSPAWEIDEPGHGSPTTHWHWIEYHQLPATYVPKPGSPRKPCDCIPIRMSSGSKPNGA